MNVRIPSTAAGGGGLTDAPSDGNQYARKNGSWDVVLGGGGSAYVEVNTFADLPSAASNSGVTYLVRTAQGVIFVNRKPKGLYRSDGSIWERLDDESEAYFQDTLAWTNITSKPSTFPPVIGSGAGDAVAGNDSRLTDARTPTTHSHAQSDITNLVSDLASKAASSHTHAYSSLTSIPSTFTPSTHSHAQSDVTNLVSDLAGKAASSHTHAQSDVTGLTSALSGKEPIQSWGSLSGTSPALTFGATKQNLTLTTSGNTTFTSSGYAQGYEIELYLTEGNAVLRTLAFPSWTWLEGAPASLAASKSMRITLKCTGATAASVFATYAVQL